MISMFVADTHVHLLGSEKPSEVEASMDKAGVDLLVVIAPYKQTFMPQGRVSCANIKSVRMGNDFVANLVKNLPDRLRGYAFITGLGDTEENLRELERAIQDLGLHGVKMFPNLGWYPDDPRMDPIYELIEDLRVPILFHSGVVPWISDIHGQGPLLSKYSRPVYYEGVVRKFPKLKIILAHMGWPWFMESITVAYLTPNIYLDLCTDFTTATARLKEEALKMALETIGVERLLYASDATPLGWEYMREHLDRTVKLLRRLKVSEEDIAKILGGNARKLFKL